MSQLKSVAIDIGSGITKVIAGEKRAHFPSLSGVPVKDAYKIKDAPASIVRFNGKEFCVGEKTFAWVNPTDVVDSRTDRWFEEDGYRALFYAALGSVLEPNFKGRINLCTGLPVGFYNEAKEGLINKLTGDHKFRIGNSNYSVCVRRPNIYVVPQAVGLYFWGLDEIDALDNRRCGFIDIGTYTTGWVMIERFDVLAWATGGHRLGVANLKDALAKHLKENFSVECTRSVIEDALTNEHMEIANSKIGLEEAIKDLSMRSARPLTQALKKSWGNAKEADIYIGGGGTEFFYPAIKTVFPHAKRLTAKDPIFSVVEGYWRWLEQKMKRRASVA